MATEEQVYYHSRADFVEMADGKSTVEEEIAKRSKVGHTHPATDVIQDATHRFTSDAEKASTAEQAVYTNANKVPAILGGVEIGSTFSNTPIKTILTEMLYPYIHPVETITVVPNGGVYERGTYVDISKISADVAPRTNAIRKIDLTIGETTLVSDNVGDTTETVTKIYTYQAGEARVSADNVVTLTATDVTGKTSSVASNEFKFVHPIYYGSIAANASINESVVTGLTKSIEVKNTKFTKSFNCSYQKAVFAYPASYGNLTAIYDPNGLNILPTFTRSQVNIVCRDGSTVSYNVYVNGASTVSNFSISFCL